MTCVEQQNGFILLPVVLLISLVATLAFMLNQQSAQDTGRVGSLAELKQSEYVAQAALQHTLAQITQAGCGPYTDISSEPLSNHNYSSTITTNNAGGTITAYTVAVSDDAFIREDLPTNNYGSNANLEVYKKWFSNEERRALYRFDIAASGIPVGALVVSAVAKIFVVTPDPYMWVSLHQVTKDWTEGAVTWNNIAGDHDPSSVTSITKNLPAGQYVDVNITSLVQGWINGSVANQGIMLKQSTLPSNTLSEYTSKEYGNTSQGPELVIKVADGSLSNRADVTATGTLANGVSRTVTRSDISLYQSSLGSLSFQPDVSAGKDGWVNSDQPTNNYGATGEMLINGGATAKHFLNQFDISSIPFGSKIVSAKLEMYLAYIGVQNLAAEFSVHGLKQDWAEGTGDNWDPGDGANWNTSDGSTAWSWSNNHSINPIASTSINSTFDGWHSWEISSLVQQWVSGKSPNYGLLIKGNDNAVGAGFYSSDNSTATLRPKLTITYSCECGVTCQIPQGSGNILLVVGDDVTLDSGDARKKALFQAWGYSINLINDDADQATFDAALANNDVAYISETVWGLTLADKLAATDKGVVNEEEDQDSRLGLSSSGSNIVSDSMEVIDNSHYITALFPNGLLPIFSAPMEGMLVTGTPAPGLRILGNFFGTASLALVEKDDALGGSKNGENAVGRRVAVPIGSNNKFNWNYLNNNGRLIVQRSIQWGMGADVASPPGPIAHWKLDDAAGTTAVDSEGSHDGTLTNGPTWTTGQDNGALDFDGSNDYVDMTSDEVLDDVFHGGATVMAWIRATDWGESEHGRVLDKSSQTAGDRDGWMIAVNGDNPSVEIAQGFTGDRGYWRTQAGTFTLNVWVHIAFVYDSSSAANDPVIYLNGVAQSSLVEVPPSGTLRSDASISLRMGNHAQSTSRTFDGKIDDVRIYDRMLDAAEINDIASGVGGGEGAGCNGTFRDEFNDIRYDQNDGTLNWATTWEETGETNDPTGGDIRIDNDEGTYELKVRDDGQTIVREVDLSQAGAATLSFDYWRKDLSGSSDYVAVEVSYNGGSNWTELDRFTGTADDSAYISTSYTLEAGSLSANTRIRFLTPSSGMNNDNQVLFDNIQIQCNP